MTKYFTLTAAALALLTIGAHASDADTATGIATIIAYDQQCEKLPRAVERAAMEALETIPTSAFKTATSKVMSQYQREGAMAWCKITKPVIEGAMPR